MDKKYQIFISSTFADLVQERQAVSRAILDMGHIPAGMEMFPAADVEQLTYIKKVIDECDYYVLVTGGRYGSLDDEGVSYTEREYEYATNSGKTVLAFLHRNIDSIPHGNTDKNDEKHAKLKAFIDRVSNGRLVQYWDNAGTLESKAIISLNKAFSENPQTGWVRANQIADSSAMADIVKYRNQVDELTGELESARSLLSPKFDDIADLSVEIEFEYKYCPFGEKLKTRWRKVSIIDFLKFIAPSLHLASRASAAESALCLAFKDRFDASAGCDVYMNSFQVHDVLMHLVGTGHVKMLQGDKPDESGSTVMYQLTPLGSKAWQENSYIKKQKIIAI
jgi:Domain of unknown function (DUF4062)